MTKPEIIAAMAHKADMTQDTTRRALDALAELAAEYLASGVDFHIPGIARFYVKHSKPRNGMNPKTGERLTIPSKPRVQVRISGAVKRAAGAA